MWSFFPLPPFTNSALSTSRTYYNNIIIIFNKYYYNNNIPPVQVFCGWPEGDFQAFLGFWNADGHVGAWTDVCEDQCGRLVAVAAAADDDHDQVECYDGGNTVVGQNQTIPNEAPPHLVMSQISTDGAKYLIRTQHQGYVVFLEENVTHMGTKPIYAIYAFHLDTIINIV